MFRCASVRLGLTTADTSYLQNRHVKFRQDPSHTGWTPARAMKASTGRSAASGKLRPAAAKAARTPPASTAPDRQLPKEFSLSYHNWDL